MRFNRVYFLKKGIFYAFSFPTQTGFELAVHNSEFAIAISWLANGHSYYFQKLQLFKNSFTAVLAISSSSYSNLGTFSWSFVAMKKYARTNSLHLKNVLSENHCMYNKYMCSFIYKYLNIFCQWQASFLALLKFILQIYFSSLIQTLTEVIFNHSWWKYLYQNSGN